MNPQYLFVYGTLRRDLGNGKHVLMEGHGDFIGHATFQGKLYLISYDLCPSTFDVRASYHFIDTSIQGDQKSRYEEILSDCYPGAVPSHKRSDIVIGQVFRLKNPESLLTKLDEYEECSPKFQQPTEYIRQMRPVRLMGDKVVQAWIYIYNRPTGGLEQLGSGDFLLYKAR